MNFTYKSYEELIDKLHAQGYAFSSYSNWKETSKCVIMRHDIDYDIEKACRLALLEKQKQIVSTYFVLVTSDFYNIFSARNTELLHVISSCGHEIGLHFDEIRYPDLQTIDELRDKIIQESMILSIVTGHSVDVVSMHRPSQMMLDSNLTIPGIINSYGDVFFKEFKYVSDSRRRWREPIEEIIASKEYNRLHILTHAFWYNNYEMDIHDSVCLFINNGNKQRYINMKSNIKELHTIMVESEIE